MIFNVFHPQDTVDVSTATWLILDAPEVINDWAEEWRFLLADAMPLLWKCILTVT